MSRKDNNIRDLHVWWQRRDVQDIICHVHRQERVHSRVHRVRLMRITPKTHGRKVGVHRPRWDAGNTNVRLYEIVPSGRGKGSDGMLGGAIYPSSRVGFMARDGPHVDDMTPVTRLFVVIMMARFIVSYGGMVEGMFVWLYGCMVCMAVCTLPSCP